ncbi:unnamed protein product [Parnassius apollo]|uniref:(apollo) hypothetical protein n=1 Tax=Parnassius apollo TaxID=110799 RepID=A0A8S3XUR5_PARAO|nr:unnamed protein product [Parnassius apollo]
MESRLGNIIIKRVSEEDVIERERLIPEQLKQFRGSLSVHQVLWNMFKPKITVRNTGCFLCDAGEICSHAKHVGYINNMSATNQEDDFDSCVVTLANTKRKSKNENEI